MTCRGPLAHQINFLIDFRTKILLGTAGKTLILYKLSNVEHFQVQKEQ